MKNIFITAVIVLTSLTSAVASADIKCKVANGKMQLDMQTVGDNVLLTYKDASRKVLLNKIAASDVVRQGKNVVVTLNSWNMSAILLDYDAAGKELKGLLRFEESSAQVYDYEMTCLR